MPHDWRPIETAPRDGTEILVSRAVNADGASIRKKIWGLFVQRASWWGDEWVVYCSLPVEPRLFFEPTHWMPVPPNPLWPKAFNQGGEDRAPSLGRLQPARPGEGPGALPPMRSTKETLAALSESLSGNQAARKRLVYKFLTAAGWEHTCEIGSLWLWRKEVNGAVVYVNEITALHLVENELPVQEAPDALG